MNSLRLVIWDVDGTLVNSRASITAAMHDAFEACRLDYPGDTAAMSGVGLSIDVLFQRILPEADSTQIAALSDAYRQAYYTRREALGTKALAPLYDGAAEMLRELHAMDWTLMAVATGKSRRGLNAMIDTYGLDGYFQSTQTADDQLSKPHPAMIDAALSDTGVAPQRAVMIGDTSYDMDMARAAGVASLGVTWGYHTAEMLNADRIVDRMDQIGPAIDELIGA